MPHVLMGFAEALAAPEAFFSLHHAGHRVSVWAREGAGGPMLTRLPLAGVHTIPAPERDAGAARTAFADLLARTNPDAVLPLDDPGLWLADAVMGADPRLAGGQGAAVAVALDKAAQIEAARDAGLAVPETHVIRAPGDLDAVTTFPALAKPARAVGLTADGTALAKGGATYLTGPADVQALAGRLGPQMAPLLVQPLIRGVGEGVFGFARETGVSHLSAHRRLRMMNPHGSGSSACQAIAVDPALAGPVERFIAAIGWRGPFMVELLRDAAGTAWFMELNGRMWGSMALARAQGFDYPAWAVAQALDAGFTPPPASPRPGLTARHLGRDLLHLAFVARGPRSDFYRPDWPRLIPSLRAVLKGADRTYDADPAFPGFARAEAWHLIRGMIRR